MALLNIFKPKWQSPDPKVRLKAIEAISPDSPELDSLVKDDDLLVRQAALAKITDCEHLQMLSMSCNQTVQWEINCYLEQLFLQRLLNSSNLTDQGAENDLSHISSQEMLAQIVTSDIDRHIRLLAVQKITDEQILSRIIEENCGKEPALAALAQINDEDLLARAADHANNRTVRARAAERLAELSKAKHQITPVELRDKQLTELLQKVRDIAASADPEKAWHNFNEILTSWQSLSPPQDHNLLPEFNDLQSKINDRYEAFISFDNEKKKKFLAHDTLLRRLDEIIVNIKALCSSLPPDNSEKFKELQDDWQQNTSNPDFEIPAKFFDKYGQICRNYQDISETVQQERDVQNSFFKEIEQINNLLKKENFKQTFKAINELSAKINNWQPKFSDKDEITQKVNTLHHRAEKQKKEHNAQLTARRQENLDKRLALLADLRNMLTEPDVEDSTRKLPELKEQWKKPVDLPPDAPDLDEEFQNLLKEFRLRQDDFFRVRDWQLWQNKTLKEELIKEANNLDNENDLHLVFKKIKEVQTKWQEIGNAPAKENNKLWRDFKNATDRNFKRCQLFFKEQDEISKVNLGKKMAICRKAQELQESEEWRKTADILKDLQEEWRKAGRAPKDQDNEVYAVFREACDHFFKRRQEYYLALDRQRQENLTKKEDLCQQVEKINNSPKLEDKKAIQTIQKDWRKIGPAPKEQNDAIWQRFKTACDQYYQWLDTLKPGNLKEKEILCDEVDTLVSQINKKTNYRKMAEELTALQEKWRTIGPAPAEQQDAIWQRFKKSCDVFFTARRDFFAQIDQQRPGNEYLKKKVLARLKELVELNTRSAVKEIIALQEEWPSIGQGNRNTDNQLQRQFTETCNNFFKNRREVFQEMDSIRRENLKQKEALCLRLELITGANQNPKSKPATSQALTLAEQLQLAFETNFVMAGSEKDHRRKKDEFEQIREEWQKIGPIPKEHEHTIKRRYEAGIKAYYKSNDTGRKGN